MITFLLAAEHSFGSRPGRVFLYGVRKLLGRRSGCYRMLSDGPKITPHAINVNIRPR